MYILIEVCGDRFDGGWFPFSAITPGQYAQVPFRQLSIIFSSAEIDFVTSFLRLNLESSCSLAACQMGLRLKRFCICCWILVEDEGLIIPMNDVKATYTPICHHISVYQLTAG